MRRKMVFVISLLLLGLVSKLWIGIYTDDEFDEKHIFIKHRPIWKTFFYSPRGMRDLETSKMPLDQQNEQKLFDEFIVQERTP